MRGKTKIIIPILVSLGYTISSFFIKIVPCQISPNIPNPSYLWTLCTLNPNKVSLFGIRELYWGITTQLSEAYLISLGSVFVCTLLIFYLFPHKKSRLKDKKDSERGFKTY